MAAIFNQAISRVDREWLEFMNTRGLLEEARKIMTGLDEAYARDHKDSSFADIMCPVAADVFAFTRECPFDRVRIVIVGQDPYMKREQADGRAFSVPTGAAIPPSLRNIYAALIAHGLMRAEGARTTGNLSKWVRQGVVLINTALTTTVGVAGAHIEEWADYTHRFIIEIGNTHPGAIYILLGKHAQKLARYIPKSCASLEWSHPSPQSTANRDPANPQHFSKCTVFTVANNMLIANGHAPIDWDPVDYAPITPVAPVAPVTTPPFVAPTPRICGKISREHIERGHDLFVPDVFGNRIVAFVDGAASRNGSDDATAAYAAIISCGETLYTIQGVLVAVAERDGKVLVPTNNRAELMAMRDMFALLASEEFIIEHGSVSASGNARPLLIAYDSAYAAGCIREWYEKWCKVPPREIKHNLDIIGAAYEYKKRVEAAREITWEHVKSHKTAPKEARAHYLWLGNSRVDMIAQELKPSASVSASAPSK